MAKISDLVDLILKIEGIEHYILVRDDGHTLSHNFPETGTLPSIITFNGLNSEALKPIMGLSYFKYMSYTRDNNENLLIFPLGKYFIGISQQSEAYTLDIVEKIEAAFETISSK